MALEIERKFLVKNKEYQKLGQGIQYKQGYLSTDVERVVRIRIIHDTGFLTIKGKSSGITRKEFEYEIPLEDARSLLLLCEQPIIEKIRYKISWENLIWEIDEFQGLNLGLIIAEVELSSEDQEIILPPWIGKEVSDDPRYFNSNLIHDPFSQWEENKSSPQILAD